MNSSNNETVVLSDGEKFKQMYELDENDINLKSNQLEQAIGKGMPGLFSILTKEELSEDDHVFINLCTRHWSLYCAFEPRDCRGFA